MGIYLFFFFSIACFENFVLLFCFGIVNSSYHDFPVMHRFCGSVVKIVLVVNLDGRVCYGEKYPHNTICYLYEQLLTYF